MKVHRAKYILRALTRWGLAPAALYLAAFSILTWPLILSFSSAFFTDAGDGLQNVWNLWWVREAILERGQHPWRTDMLHHPMGVTLAGHTLNPYNGLTGLALAPFLSLTQIHNFAVVSGFVLGAMGAFALAWYVTRSYGGALVGGFIFSFSSFHFAHAQGHLQLVSLQWIPFFVLAWLTLMDRPSHRRAAAAAAALLLVLLCDYYYFFFCFIAAVGIALWKGVQERNLGFAIRQPHRLPLITFLAASAATSGSLILYLVVQNRIDPLLGSHRTDWYSMDLLAPFIPGGLWRFGALTRGYWSRLPGDLPESSVYLGWSVVAFLILAARLRPRLARTSPGLWFAMIALFGLLALGPRLRIAGAVTAPVPMPYALLELLPPLRLSGVPVRMIVMATLAASVLCAAVWARRDRLARPLRLAVGALPLIYALECLPAPLPRTSFVTPGYVAFLRDSPEPGAVIDTHALDSLALYYQTIHERPMSFGYVSRTPRSVFEFDMELHAAIVDALDRGRWQPLRDRYGYRYLVLDASERLPAGPAEPGLVFEGEAARVYDLGSPASDPKALP